MLREDRRHGRGLAVRLACAFIFGVALAGPNANAQSADLPFRMVVIDDMSGIYSGNGGPGTLLAANMAIEDFGGKVLGRKIEMLSADHQSKPDIGASLARQFMDQQNVSAIVNGGASSVGLAIQAIAREKKKTTLITGGYAGNFSGDSCLKWTPEIGPNVKV